MNYIQLVQRLSQEVGASGSISTVVGAVGEVKRLCGWISLAWQEIQEEHQEWDWMRGEVTFNTVVAKQSYTPVEAGITDFAMWKTDAFRAYITSTGIGSEMFVLPMPYADFRDYYNFGARRYTYGRPISIAVKPDKSLMLGPAPDQIYTMLGEYFKTASYLVADTDIPSMPDRFHIAIVYRAMMHYGMFEAAPEVVQRGENLYNEQMNRLELDQLQGVSIAGPLA